MLSSLCCRQSRNKQSYAEKLAKMDWYQLCLLCPASEDMVPPREPPGSQEERGKNGEGKTQRSPQGLRATPLQSPPCAGAALLCSRVRSVPDNFLAPVLCCRAVFPHP